MSSVNSTRNAGKAAASASPPKTKPTWGRVAASIQRRPSVVEEHDRNFRRRTDALRAILQKPPGQREEAEVAEVVEHVK